MAQTPVLTQLQCSPTGPNFMVRVSWQHIQEQTYFVAAVFDSTNVLVVKQTVDGSRGTNVAAFNGVTLAPGTSYTAQVAQSDASGNLTSSYSFPLNVLQGPLTSIQTTNDMTSVTIAATLPAVGSPAGISVNLFDSNNAPVASGNISGPSGVIELSPPLNPAATYYVYLAPFSNEGLSTGGHQRVDLQMARPAISAVGYDGASMTVATATTLPTGAIVRGTLRADGNAIQQKDGGAASVSFDLAMASLDMSKQYSCVLRAVTGGNAGPASPAELAVVAPPRVESAYYTGGHVGARWTVPPIVPAPTGASLTAIADGNAAGQPVTTFGYLGDVDISKVTVATSLKVQINSVFGVAKGPPALVDLPFSKPTITAVLTTSQGINVSWNNSGSAPAYRLYLNDSKGSTVAFVNTADMLGALALSVNADAAYSVTVQPFAMVGAVEVRGPISDPVPLLAAAPAVTGTSYDGAKVTVNWTIPRQTAGITGYEAVLLDAETLQPTGAAATAAAGATSASINVALDPASRLVAAVRATGSSTKGAPGAAVEVIAFAPAITATDVSATTVDVAWSAAPAANVTGYTVTISDDANSPTTQTFHTSGTSLRVPNTLGAAQVYVRVTANGASSTGPAAAPVNLFGTTPGFYPQPASLTDPSPVLIRASTNQPAAADITFAFPDIFTTAPATLPSAGIFALQANAASPVLPYKLTVPASSVAWKFDAASRATLAGDFLNFLKKVEMPDGATVQIKAGALAALRQSLALGLPLLFSEQLQFMYGFNPDPQTGGYVDLVPGMRLRVDSELQQLTPPSNNQTGYVPAGMSTYDIQSYVQGQSLETGFNAFLSALGRPIVKTPLQAPNGGGGGVIDMYTATGRRAYFRLLYPSEIHDPKYTGLVDQSSLPVILGAASYNVLLAATDQYIGQGNFAGLDVFPFFFRGRATLTPEISASLNGQRCWLALGSTVANLIALHGAMPGFVTAAVGGFSMRRSVGGLSSDIAASSIATTAVVTNRVRLEYPKAPFSPTQPGYFGLPLFCGDEIRLGQGGSG